MPEVEASVEGAPDPEAGEALRIAREAHLAGVRMLSMRCGLQVPQQIDGPLTVDSKLTFGWTRTDIGVSCAFRANVSLRAPEPEHPVFSCDVVYESIYAVDDSARFGDREIVAFAKSSGLLASWPYIRESVQSASTRCGLQPITLDVLRVNLAPLTRSENAEG